MCSSDLNASTSIVCESSLTYLRTCLARQCLEKEARGVGTYLVELAEVADDDVAVGFDDGEGEEKVEVLAEVVGPEDLP